jgi:tetratricopeptide (TPR) repeat protein
LDAIAEFLRPRLGEILTTNPESCHDRNRAEIENDPILFPTSSQRESGNNACARHDFTSALDVFVAMLCNDPQDPVVQLDTSRSQLALGDLNNALEGFKRVISLIRRRVRHGASVKSPADGQESAVDGATGIAFTSQQLSHAAYAGMGAAFGAMGKPSRAITCYVLALKQLRPRAGTVPPVSVYHPLGLDQLPSPPHHAQTSVSQVSSPPFGRDESSRSIGVHRTVDAELELHNMLQTHNAAVERSVGDGTTAAREVSSLHTPSTTSEIEEALSLHSIKSLHDPFGFSCTMCGECCRTSDNIMLTPLDIFDMTR